MKRRSFFYLSLKIVGAFFLVVVARAFGKFMFWSSEGSKIREAPKAILDKLSIGEPHHLVDAGVWLNKTPDSMTAFDDRCTHLGCKQKWNPELRIYQCPCHGSEFDINGFVLKGPATKPLNKLRIIESKNSFIEFVDQK